MAATSPRAFHVMAKPTGAICNLDCAYCFFLAKEELYPGSDFRMSESLLGTYLTQLLRAHPDGEVVVALQGGEPTLMGVEFVRRTSQLARAVAGPQQQVLVTMQTNGTLLDDAWGAMLAEEGVLVGLSIDGPREWHDAYRVDKGGKPTFDRVMAGLDVLRRHDVEWNALTTVHAANGDHGREVYTFLRDDLGARFVQLIPIVERVGADGVTDRTVGPDQYGRFLVEVFDTALAHWLGMHQTGMCVHARTCGSAVALEHNGDLYSCDHFVEPKFKLGNIHEKHMLEMVASPEQRRFGDDKRDTLTAQCQRCEVKPLCNGGCPKDRFTVSRDGEAGQNYLCGGLELFFKHTLPLMRTMAQLFQRGRHVAEVMPLIAAEDAKRDPYQSCPCGSGKSFRFCHGDKSPRSRSSGLPSAMAAPPNE